MWISASGTFIATLRLVRWVVQTYYDLTEWHPPASHFPDHTLGDPSA
jgi:hypothetical protein